MRDLGAALSRTKEPQWEVALRGLYKVQRSWALLTRDQVLFERSLEQVARSQNLIQAVAEVGTMAAQPGIEAGAGGRRRPEARLARDDDMTSPRTLRCSLLGCEHEPTYRALLEATVGENETWLAGLGLHVCGAHRADLGDVLRDARVIRVLRERIEARRGADVPIHAIRAVFKPLAAGSPRR